MGWRDRLRDASFRGVPFFVESGEDSGGRTVAVHKFADRKTPYSEDTGKEVDSYTFEAYVIGKDCIEKKEALVAALVEEEEAELIHPYLGRLVVQAGAYKVSFSDKEGGMFKFSLSFTEKGEILYPSSINDNQALLSESAGSVISSSKSAFDKAYSLVSAPGHVVEAARSGVKLAQEKFKEATKLITATADGLANFAYQMKGLDNDVGTLLASPSKLSERLQFSIGLVAGLGDDPAQISLAMKNIGLFSNETSSPYVTKSVERANQNNLELENLIIRTSLAQEAMALSESSFETGDDADAAFEGIQERIRSQMDQTTDDDVFQSLSDMLANLSDLLLDQSLYFKTKLNYTSERSLPVLIHVFEKLGTIENEEDFIKRNKVIHPGFVPPGELEIVSE